jgi:hypothetical protein
MARKKSDWFCKNCGAYKKPEQYKSMMYHFCPSSRKVIVLSDIVFTIKDPVDYEDRYYWITD